MLWLLLVGLSRVGVGIDSGVRAGTEVFRKLLALGGGKAGKKGLKVPQIDNVPGPD